MRPNAILAGLLCALCHVQTAAAQTLGQGEDVTVAWWRVLAAFALCVALGVADAFALRARLGGRAPALPKFLRRHGEGAPERRLRLIESLRVSHQVDVCLVACDGREILVASSPQGVAVMNAPKAEDQA